MINVSDILETITMFEDENLDVRTITMGISLLDCCDSDINKTCARVYDKITRYAKNLVATGEQIEKEFGVPIIHKRISVTPIAMILAACEDKDAVKLAVTLEKAATACGVNFIGGFSALVQKGFSPGDRELIEAIPEALSVTEHVCSSVNIGSTKAGINMDAVALMGRIVKDTAARRRSPPTAAASAAPSWWCSATRRRITPLWRGRSMARANRIASSTWAFPVPVWCARRLPRRAIAI